MHKEVNEDVIPRLVMGNSIGVDNSDTQSDYSKRMMTLPPVEMPKPKITSFIDGEQNFQLLTGFNSGIDDSPTQSDYSKRAMQLPPVENPNPV